MPLSSLFTFLVDSQSAFGVTYAGEWSNGFNDCGLFLLGVGGTPSYGGNCRDWEDSSNWTPGTKAGIMQLALAQMDVLQDYFFWTWKVRHLSFTESVYPYPGSQVGNSSTGIVESPLWSYQLGLENGWMPKDPRVANGVCASLGVAGSPFDGTYQPWMTGGPGAGAIVASATILYAWPPALISGVNASAALMPSYTPTGIIPTLPPPTLTPAPTKSVDVGNGWYDAQDTAGAMTPIAGCNYPNAWDAMGAALPPLCGGGGGGGIPLPPPTVAPGVATPTTTTDTR